MIQFYKCTFQCGFGFPHQFISIFSLKEGIEKNCLYLYMAVSVDILQSFLQMVIDFFHVLLPAGVQDYS